ncbi:MAG: DNA primase [Candidatus Omnitrophica bacterium]|nr:DNA primase [Candidatus Omnitrophota bacterium]
MPLIPESVIDEIHARADIVELISRYVPLKRAGRHFKANCPFHKEKTPSFMVNTDKQIFHCFGCGVGGNVFSFLMQHDRLTFPEAVRQLADHAGIRLPDRDSAASDGSQARLAALMEKVCRYFERMLLDPQGGKAARAYLKTRGVSEQTRERFRLGLAPSGWDRLLTAAKATGVSPEQLEAAGFLIQGRSGHYDRFRSRLMFPIQDVRGRIVGFGGRSLDGQEPKYLNSPETALYTKGRHVFGLGLAKDAIIKAKTVVVVEGYFDCVVLADAGISHVVSPLGTALTADQARLLKRYAEQAILAFDADAAGEQATLRGIDLLVEAGLQVRVAQLPEGVDPDEYLQSYGRERLEQLLEGSASLFDVLVQSAVRRFPATDAEGTVNAAQFVLPTIAKVPDAMLRREYVRLLAERLRLDEGAVAQELGKVQPRLAAEALRQATGPPAGTPPGAGPGSMRRSGAQGPERLFTALILDEPVRWRQATQAGFSLEEVTDPILRRILTVICELEATGRAATPAHVVSRLLEDGDGGLVTELVELANSVASKEEALDDCLRRLRANARRRELAQFREQIRAAHEAGQEVEVRRLLAEYQHRLSAASSVCPPSRSGGDRQAAQADISTLQKGG